MATAPTRALTTRSHRERATPGVSFRVAALLIAIILGHDLVMAQAISAHALPAFDPGAPASHAPLSHAVHGGRPAAPSDVRPPVASGLPIARMGGRAAHHGAGPGTSVTVVGVAADRQLPRPGGHRDAMSCASGRLATLSSRDGPSSEVSSGDHGAVERLFLSPRTVGNAKGRGDAARRPDPSRSVFQVWRL